MDKVKTIKISNQNQNNIRLHRTNCAYRHSNQSELDIVNRIINYKIKNNDFDFYKEKKIETLESILNHLKGVRSLKSFTNEDRNKSIDDINETIKYIKEIKLNSSNTHEELLCKLYLILNYGELTYLLERVSSNLLEVKIYKFNKDKKHYSKEKSKIILYPEDYNFYRYGYSLSESLCKNRRISFRRAIINEFNKNSELGRKALIMQNRNNYGFNTRHRWCSDNELLRLTTKK